jgi:hypothetical protein
MRKALAIEVLRWRPDLRLEIVVWIGRHVSSEEKMIELTSSPGSSTKERRFHPRINPGVFPRRLDNPYSESTPEQPLPFHNWSQPGATGREATLHLSGN